MCIRDRYRGIWWGYPCIKWGIIWVRKDYRKRGGRTCRYFFRSGSLCSNRGSQETGVQGQDSSSTSSWQRRQILLNWSFQRLIKYIMIANKTPLRCLFAYNSIDSLNTINFSFVLDSRVTIYLYIFGFWSYEYLGIIY